MSIREALEELVASSETAGFLSPVGARRLDRALKAARAALSAQPAQESFDAWQENQYTKVLQKSIAEDYVPRAQPAQEPVGEVVIGEEGMTKGWTVIRWRADLPPIAVGTKLYASPVTQPATKTPKGE